MGLISRFGNFLDRLFAPKATISSVLELKEMHDKSIISQDQRWIEISSSSFGKLQDDILKLRDELNAIKALYKIGGTQKPTATPPNQQKFDGSQPWKR